MRRKSYGKTCFFLTESTDIHRLHSSMTNYILHICNHVFSQIKNLSHFHRHVYFYSYIYFSYIVSVALVFRLHSQHLKHELNVGPREYLSQKKKKKKKNIIFRIFKLLLQSDYRSDRDTGGVFGPNFDGRIDRYVLLLPSGRFRFGLLVFPKVTWRLISRAVRTAATTQSTDGELRIARIQQ